MIITAKQGSRQDQLNNEWDLDYFLKSQSVGEVRQISKDACSAPERGPLPGPHQLPPFRSQTTRQEQVFLIVFLQSSAIGFESQSYSLAAFYHSTQPESPDPLNLPLSNIKSFWGNMKRLCTQLQPRASTKGGTCRWNQVGLCGEGIPSLKSHDGEGPSADSGGTLRADLGGGDEPSNIHI